MNTHFYIFRVFAKRDDTGGHQCNAQNDNVDRHSDGVFRTPETHKKIKKIKHPTDVNG